jgi:GDP-D-mannose 3',5'-epimerase
MKRAIVIGSSGFIGQHLAQRLKDEGYYVYGFDKKVPEFSEEACSQFAMVDFRNTASVFMLFQSIARVEKHVDEVYQLAADMGGAGFVFTGANDAAILSNSARINLNVVENCRQISAGKVFFASSACVYRDCEMNPHWDRGDPLGCREIDAIPANPDSEYGWEKLFSERLYQAYARNSGMDIKIARFHNVFGPFGTWRGGREKAPAAICRKVAEAADGGQVEIWGDGTQTRSFLYIDEAIEGVRRLMNSDFSGPVNIGSDQPITIDGLLLMTARIAGKTVRPLHIHGPIGVQGRNSDNSLIKEKLGWAPSLPLEVGLTKIYDWISEQVAAARPPKP